VPAVVEQAGVAMARTTMKRILEALAHLFADL
jgi:hypothetical protein